jgi:hypothetical protein
MIEVVSWPADLASWDPEKQPFYLEFFGEAEPLVDAAYAEVVSPDLSAAPFSAPVYEYWWTVGHPGSIEHHEHWYTRQKADKQPWETLADPAARVYVYFPITGGWRVKEVIATLKYLIPMKDHQSLLNEAAKDLQALQPAFGAAGQVAGLIPGGATASKWMETVAKLKLSSVPQTKDLPWSAGKVTFGSKYGVMQGVVWTLPKSVFERLGGRLTGSVALSFIPASKQKSGQRGELSSLDAAVHAVVYESNGTRWWIPDAPANGRGFIHLKLSPRLTPTPKPTT